MPMPAAEPSSAPAFGHPGRFQQSWLHRGDNQASDQPRPHHHKRDELLRDEPPDWASTSTSTPASTPPQETDWTAAMQHVKIDAPTGTGFATTSVPHRTAPPALSSLFPPPPLPPTEAAGVFAYPEPTVPSSTSSAPYKRTFEPQLTNAPAPNTLWSSLSSFSTYQPLRSASPPPYSPISTHSSQSSDTSILPNPVPSWRSSQPQFTSLWSTASLQVVLRVAILFVVSTLLVGGGLITLPMHLPSRIGGLGGITHLTLGEIQTMASTLRSYARGASWFAALHTWTVLMAFYLWKQAWTVPGSIVMNVFLGMLYGTYSATLYTCLATASGGVLCFWLCRPVSPILERIPGLEKRLAAMRNALHLTPSTAFADEEQEDVHRPTPRPTRSLWTYLLLLRLVPIVPWGPMNMCCSLLGVPVGAFWFSFFLGSLPWNYCTTQVGEILIDLLDAATKPQQFAPQPDAPPTDAGLSPGTAHTTTNVIWAKLGSREMVFKLVLLTLASLLPMALQWLINRRRATEDNTPESSALTTPEDEDNTYALTAVPSGRSSSRIMSWSYDAPDQTSSSDHIPWSAPYTPPGESMSLAAPSGVARRSSVPSLHDLQGLDGGETSSDVPYQTSWHPARTPSPRQLVSPLRRERSQPLDSNQRW